MEKFEEELEEMNTENETLKLERDALKSDNKLLERNLDSMCEKRDKLVSEITAIKKEFEISLKNYKNSLALLSNSQEIRKKLQLQVEELLEENRRLGNRAAVGFEGLTPRFENFKQTFKKLKIKQPEKDRGSSRPSSIQYIEKLISCYQELKGSS